MRELSVSFGNNGKAVLGSVHNFQDEHCAVCLAVTLSSDLTSGSPDEYYLDFVRDADADNPMPQKMTVGPVQDIRDGVLYYELPSALTNTTCLAVQLVAIKYGANGSISSSVRSPAFRIIFHPSLQGEEVLPVTQEMNGLLERLLQAASQTLTVKDSLEASLAQGAFHAKINGHNAITLCGGNNLSISDNNGVVTIDCSTLPIVSSLPQNPQDDDIVLLIPQNEVARRDAEKELKTGAAMLAAVAASEMQTLAQNPVSRYPIYTNLRKNGSIVGFVSLTSDLEEDGFGQQHPISVFSFITKMRNNQPCDGYEITYIDGAFSTDRSSLLSNGTVVTLNAIPSSVRLPDFDTVEIISQETLPLPAFFASASLWVYRSRWMEITSVTEEKHIHGNKATIDCFNCDAVEAEAATPEGQPVIALQYTGWDRLRWGGAEVRMVDDGGVVDHVEAVTVNNQSYLRLWMDYGEVQTVQQGSANAHPAFIDIPIDSASSSTATQGNLTVNGTALDFGIDALETDSHTHTNKSSLDKIGDMQAASGAGTNILKVFGSNAFNDRPAVETKLLIASANDTTYLGSIYAGCVMRLGSNKATITISGFANSANYTIPEYMLDITTGSTAPTLTLPASVEWVDELTIEPNKHYQISIVDNIALWCAVDVEAEE